MNKIGSSTGPGQTAGVTSLRGDVAKAATRDTRPVPQQDVTVATSVSFSAEGEAIAGLQGQLSDEQQVRPEVVEQLRARLDSGELSRVDDALVEAVADAIVNDRGDAQ
ncbi:MAG: hypothetical protein D6761_01925 [Candidatus Dadabacteria bacterium]|nr:MAG: hypothetical protein D6761_01925 [Candidatus Dadabacteria bacterium]